MQQPLTPATANHNTRTAVLLILVPVHELQDPNMHNYDLYHGIKFSINIIPGKSTHQLFTGSKILNLLVSDPDTRVHFLFYFKKVIGQIFFYTHVSNVLNEVSIDMSTGACTCTRAKFLSGSQQCLVY